jgi:hypothetical protein
VPKNILQAKVEIVGIKPLFWDHFTEDAIPLEKQEKTGVAGNDPESWKKTFLATAEGQLYVLPTWLFATIRNGASYTKKGRGSIQPLVEATLTVLGDIVVIDRFMPDGCPPNEPPRDPSHPVYLDVRMTRNPTSKARHVTYRIAASTGWHAAFEMFWDRTVVSREQMQACVIDAGRLVGLGNARRIGMGRFEIIRFDVSEA